MKALATAMGRRGLLRGLLGAAVAAPTLGKTTPGVARLPFLAGQVSPSAQPYTEDPVKQAAWRLFWKKREERDRLPLYRLDGWDVDIHAMRSWSPAFRRAVQMERDNEARSWLEDLAKKLGLED